MGGHGGVTGVTPGPRQFSSRYNASGIFCGDFKRRKFASACCELLPLVLPVRWSRFALLLVGMAVSLCDGVLSLPAVAVRPRLVPHFYAFSL